MIVDIVVVVEEEVLLWAWFSEKLCCLLIAMSEGSFSRALIWDLLGVVVEALVVVVVRGGIGVCARWFWSLSLS